MGVGTGGVRVPVGVKVGDRVEVRVGVGVGVLVPQGIVETIVAAELALPVAQVTLAELVTDWQRLFG